MHDPTNNDMATLRAGARVVVRDGLARAIESGRLPNAAEARELVVELSRPAKPEHGDLASNLGLRLAKPLRMAPLAIASAVAEAIDDLRAEGAAHAVAAVEAAAPGFLNLRLAEPAIEAALDDARRDPASWGRAAGGAGGATAASRHVNVEFVSANPTGPLTVGNARGAFVGDLLSRVLEAGGQRVTREYYFNDSGNQVKNLGASIVAIREGRPVPDDGYNGDYVVDLAPHMPEELATIDAARSTGEEERDFAVGRWASNRIRAGIEASLANLGVRFDVWTTEASLHDDGWVDQALARLRDGGHLYEQDGALWFRSTAFGDDKDRVLVKSDGNRTYFAADIGYVIEKFSRGFDHLIYIWGADHHGTVARLRNAAEAMGLDKDHVEVILTGWVHFLQNGQELSMSKRAGTFIALDDLLAELGVDAARWYFASRGANVNMDVDIEAAKAQSSDNPVYYVQYAHARIASILRKAAENDLAPAASLEGALGAGSPEAVLARVVARLPEVVEDAAAAQETQGVTTYATELATAFHAFYRDARVVDADQPQRSRRRLALVDATRISLANALALLGISAPEQM